MDNIPTPPIVSADRLNEGLVILFADGQCAFYPDAFLFSKLPELPQLDETNLQW